MKVATHNTAHALLLRRPRTTYTSIPTATGPTMNDCNRVFEALANSKLFREFASAFHETTGVRLCLEPVETDLAGDGEKGSSRSVARQTMDLYGMTMLTSGMYKVVVPIKHGAQIVAVIRSGLILESPMTTGHSLSKIPVIPKPRAKALVKLIAFFADHLGVISNQMVLQQRNCEPAFILKAKQYIAAHRGDDLRLAEVAQHAQVSSYHLCKMFKKLTGINFSNYVARLRIEAAKELLLKRSLRINEVALEAGFHSLTQFNKVFKRFIGESPRTYRNRTIMVRPQSAF